MAYMILLSQTPFGHKGFTLVSTTSRFSAALLVGFGIGHFDTLHGDVNLAIDNDDDGVPFMETICGNGVVEFAPSCRIAQNFWSRDVSSRTSL